MNINLIKNIDLCYENSDVDTIEQKNLLGVLIKRRVKTTHFFNQKQCYRIKTFEVALKDTDCKLRKDLAQMTINYINGSFDHFFIAWNKDDLCYYESSLQTLHKKDNVTSLTSNCESSFVK
jgi:hypothetical protein